MAESSYVVFAGNRCVARGDAAEVVTLLKRRFDARQSESTYVMELETGRRVHFDLKGTLADALARLAPASAPRPPGRPKLGVTSREVTLLPRHWDWLAAQPEGVSATLRRLVAAAASAPSERARQTRAALYEFLSATVGDRPHFEAATRALFAGDDEAFLEASASWPRDVREHAVAQLGRAGKPRK